MGMNQALNEYRELERRGTPPDVPELEALLRSGMVRNELERQLNGIEEAAGQRYTPADRLRAKLALVDGFDPAELAENLKNRRSL